MKHRGFTMAAGTLFLASAFAWSQPPQKECGSCCRGQQGPGPHRGMAGDPTHQEDMALFHFLLDHREEIRRSVQELPDGVETLTESEDPEIAGKIREHVRPCTPSRRAVPSTAATALRRDSRYADEIEMTMVDTEGGLRVRETSTDPYVAKLIKSHAEVVSRFLANGHPEMRKNHPLPERE
jgi:hypothetical protein